MTTELKKEIVILGGRPVERMVQVEWFCYAAQVLALAPAGVLTSTIQFEAASEFCLERLSWSADIAGAAQTVSSVVNPNVSVQINDSGEGKNLFQVPIAVTAIAGQGTLPHILPVKRRFKPSASVLFTFTSFEAAVTYARLTLVLEGYKAYPFNSQPSA